MTKALCTVTRTMKASLLTRMFTTSTMVQNLLVPQPTKWLAKLT